MMKDRKTEISYLNILFCLFVVFIHIISYAVAGFTPQSLKYNIVMFPWRMVSIVVPGFIFLSGLKLFLTGKNNLSFSKYILSRINGIILPYLLCFALYYLFYVFAYGYEFDIKFIIEQLLSGSLVCHLYFIPLIFQFDLLFPVWKRLIDRVHPIIIISIAIMFTSLFSMHFPDMVSNIIPGFIFPYNDRFFMTYLVYWICGCYAGKYYDRFKEMLKVNFKAICIIFTTVFAIFIFFTYLAFNYITYIPYMNQIHDIYVICAIVFLFAVFSKLPQKMPRILSLMDRSSYDIYLWHMLFVLLADHVISKFAVTAQFPAFAIRFAFAYLITIPLCIAYTHIKKKLKRRKTSK